MALTALDVYKLLPKTNCRECGFPTCLAFAMQLAAGKAGIDRCPPAPEETKALLGAAAAPPLPRVIVGTGAGAVVLGDETVLYRHEGTFHHPTVLAVSVADGTDDDALAARFAAIRRLSFDRVGQALSVDLVGIRHTSGDPERFARVAAAALEDVGRPLLLRGPAAALAAAAGTTGVSRPLLWPPPEEAAAAARIAAAGDLPLVVGARGLSALAVAATAARAAGAADIVVDPLPGNPAAALTAAADVRRLAIAHRAREIAFPAAFDLGGGFPQPFAAACLLIPKYGSLLLLDTADPAAILPLLTLRQNIFTDPRRPIQVEPGIYPIGKPGPSSPLLVTTNFSLTFFTVRGDVEASKVPAHLLVADCDGMSVLTAWAAGKLTAQSVAALLSAGGVTDRVAHRTLILPGLVARLSGAVEEASGWRVLVGPQESSALASYLRRLSPEVLAPAHG